MFMNKQATEQVIAWCESGFEGGVESLINEGIYQGPNQDAWDRSSEIVNDLLLAALDARLADDKEGYREASEHLVSFLIKGMEASYE